MTITRNKIFTIKEIEKTAQKFKKEKKTIVTCNGIFDILRIGHINFLKEAKSKSDILIIGLNSDKSVRKNKGPNRSINNELNRAEFLAAFECINYIVIFYEKDPRFVINY